jgi:hypothetical protein
MIRPIIIGTAALALLAACGGSDQSSQIASAITSQFPGTYANEAGSDGSANVDSMSCTETGSTAQYTCVGKIDIQPTDSTLPLVYYQLFIDATADNNGNATWHVTSQTQVNS